MKITVYILLGLTLFLVLFGLLYFFTRRQFLVKQRLFEIGINVEENNGDIDLAQYTSKPKEESSLFYIPLIGAYLRKTTEQMQQAHLFFKPGELLAITLLIPLFLFFTFLAVTSNLVLSLPPSIVGLFIPKLYVTSAQTKRKKALSNQLPEFLNILSNALRAGLSFNQAIATAGNEMSDPIRWEFQKVMRDNSLGRPMDEALQELANRTGDEDVEMLVSAIIIQRQVGGNLSEVLDMIAQTIRDRVKLKGEIRTLTAQNKLSAWIVGLLPIVISFALTLVNPQYLEPLFTELLGQILIGLAIIMMIMGALVLKNITTLEV